jgi:hypothetical protein
MGHVCEVRSIPQRAHVNHQVNPGGKGGKCLEGGEDCRTLCVEKPPAPASNLTLIVD